MEHYMLSTKTANKRQKKLQNNTRENGSELDKNCEKQTRMEALWIGFHPAVDDQCQYISSEKKPLSHPNQFFYNIYKLYLKD